MQQLLQQSPALILYSKHQSVFHEAVLQCIHASVLPLFVVKRGLFLALWQEQ